MSIKNEIIEILDTLKIYIQQDGGDFEFIDFVDNVVTIKLSGACVSCSSIDTTYQDGIQELLRDEIDKNIIVKLITD
ncbi:MAG: NifU family protein [Candidatus Ureaplasma intestinipullorum]|uniref:NifU family protein n=1 Tax=Candidatus Ureaplasma intestinipullorum TaxID=2838770 RepID=A0A9E2NVQ9_9BACT|nr:NifU family protein [Candidatus Ureaplasma intestinipullorum]